MANPENIIAFIQPKYLANPDEVKKLLKEGDEQAAIDKANLAPIWEHSIVYDSGAEQLEPVYFWILDFMRDIGFKVDKLVDNFASTVGGGYFAELGARATKMQEEGMKILGSVNTVLKSIINLIYDLKEFEIRLKQYELAESKEPREKESGFLGLKQIWLDKVDAQKGYGGINMMTRGDIGFTTLRDAFMAAKTPEDVDKMDLNDRVKRILKPRVAEFLDWQKRSQLELKKRFEIEKNYLKSQVGALKLYTRWAKPYLKAAEQLSMSEKSLKEPSLVTAFNTLLLELTILGKQEIDLKKEAEAKSIPYSFRSLKLKKPYNACVLISFTFRGIPQRVSQTGHYAFGGKVDVTFKAFALSDDELKVFDEYMKKQDFQDALKLVEITTEESLKQLTDDLDHFLEEKKEKEKPKGFFEALFGKPETPKKKEKEKGKELKTVKDLKRDTFEESVIRMYAEQIAAANCFKVYDVYKKSHGMASFAEPMWELPGVWRGQT